MNEKLAPFDSTLREKEQLLRKAAATIKQLIAVSRRQETEMAAPKESRFDKSRTADAQLQGECDRLKNRISHLERQLQESDTAKTEVIAGLKRSLAKAQADLEDERAKAREAASDEGETSPTLGSGQAEPDVLAHAQDVMTGQPQEEAKQTRQLRRRSRKRSSIAEADAEQRREVRAASQSVVESPSRIRELEHELRERNAQLKNLAGAYATAKRDVSLRDAEANTLRRLNDALKTQLEKATQENESISQSLQRFVRRSEKKEEQHRLNEVIEERDQLQSRIQTLSDKLQRSDKEIYLLNQKLRRQTRCCERLNDKLMAAKRRILALQTVKTETIVRSEHDSEDLVNRVKELVVQVDEAEAEISYLRQAKSKVDTLLADTAREYENEICKLTEHLSQLRSSYGSLSKSFERKTLEMESRYRSAQKESDNAELRIEETQRKLNQQLASQQNSELRAKRYEEVIADLKRDNDELQNFRDEVVETLLGDKRTITTTRQVVCEIARLKNRRNPLPSGDSSRLGFEQR
jgi:chromosome segregation ATPase